MIKTIYFITMVLAITAASAALSDDVSLPESLVVAGDELPLQASATRRELWVDVYHCGVYTKTSDITTNITDAGAVAVNFKVTTDLLPEKPPAVWRETLKEAISNRAYRALSDGFATLDVNDDLEFLYVPELGTTVIADGEKLFTSSGDRLIRAVLDLLVGSEPVSTDLKNQLIGSS